jgi:competence protein ComEC
MSRLGPGAVAGEPVRAADKGHDFRLVGPALAAWVAALGLVGAPAWACYLAAGCCGLGAAVALAGAAALRGRWTLLGAALACAAASAGGVGLRTSAIEASPLSELAVRQPRVTVEAVLTAEPQVQRTGPRDFVIAKARAESFLPESSRIGPADRTEPRAHDAAPSTAEPASASLDPVREGWRGVRVPVLVIAGVEGWRGLLPGQRVRFAGRLAVPRGGELLAAVVLARGRPEVIGRPPLLQRAAERVRAGLRAATDRLPADERAVLPGMVTGDTSRLDPELAERFKAAGLSHLLVVSGANLAIVAGAVLLVGRFAGLGRRGAAVVAVPAILGFVVVARPDPSVLRAAVMGLIGLLALVTGRPRSGMPALAAAVLVLVLADPELARSYGFILSVLATTGLLLMAPPLRERLERRLPGPVAEVLAIAIAAELACAPVIVMLSGEISLVAIPANLLAEPAVVPATLLGALAAPLSLVALPVARVVAWPGGLAAGWIVEVARTAASVPYAVVPWRTGLTGALLLIAALLVSLVLIRRPGPRRIGAAIVIGAVAAVVGVRMLGGGWPPPGWWFVACDVGQGDGLVLATGAPHRAVVVDAGPDPQIMDHCLTELGIRTVPLLVLTHPHADHIGGVPGVRHGRGVGTVLPSPLSAGEENRFLAGLGVHPAAPGQGWRIDRLSLEVLGPATSGPQVSTRDPGTVVNNASVVLVARWPGLSVLLPGDVETEAQEALAGRIPAVDLLKVPHHGSSRQDPAFIAATRAKAAVISVGLHNDYGHPSPATLALLTHLGMRVYRTDLDGTIAVIQTPNGPAVVARTPARPR